MLLALKILLHLLEQIFEHRLLLIRPKGDPLLMLMIDLFNMCFCQPASFISLLQQAELTFPVCIKPERPVPVKDTISNRGIMLLIICFIMKRPPLILFSECEMTLHENNNTGGIFLKL